MWSWGSTALSFCKIKAIGLNCFFWRLCWMSWYLGWKQWLCSNADIHNRCAETASLTPTALLGLDSPIKLLSAPPLPVAAQLLATSLLWCQEIVCCVLVCSHVVLCGEKQCETPLRQSWWGGETTKTNPKSQNADDKSSTALKTSFVPLSCCKKQKCSRAVATLLFVQEKSAVRKCVIVWNKLHCTDLSV